MFERQTFNASGILAPPPSRSAVFAAMPTTQKIWDRLEWQRWVSLLLFLKYGHDGYQRVPDKDRGDFGIEGFSRDGCVYQCYVADEPVSTRELYEKQRDKVTEDVRKLVSNAPSLSALLSPTRIKTWVLVVPRFESAPLLKHCAGKAEEIRAAKLRVALRGGRLRYPRLRR